MKRIIILTVTALALTLLTIPVLADQEVCPEQGKVESVVDGDIDGIVLNAGTEVCVKGGQTLVNVTADGTSTLAELLGTGQNVSHYTILEATWNTTTTTVVTGPSSTTTTPDTTTTVGSSTSTTSTVAIPTSTSPSGTAPLASTTTAPTGSMEELPTVIIEPLVIVSTTTTVPAVVLPFTGPDDVGPWMLLGFALAALGAVLVWTYRGDER